MDPGRSWRERARCVGLRLSVNGSRSPGHAHCPHALPAPSSPSRPTCPPFRRDSTVRLTHFSRVSSMGHVANPTSLQDQRGPSRTVADTSLLFGPDTMNAPWGLDSRLKLVALACDFFNVNRIAAHHTTIDKELPKQGNPTPLAAADFLQYLQIKRAFPKAPNAFHLAQILQRMVSAGVLLLAGSGSSPLAGLQDHYIYALTAHEARRGLFRLVPVLGPEYLYRLCEPGLIHVTGTNSTGDEVAGTGLVVDSRHVLTCRHVVSDMTVHPRLSATDVPGKGVRGRRGLHPPTPRG